MVSPIAAAADLLQNGDVMSREEFHRRFSECEDLERVELIEGVVYMPSPVKLRSHSRRQTLVIVWLSAYEDLHAGEVEATQEASVLLDGQNEPIPDAMLYRVDSARIDDDYFIGAPELIVEIANSSVAKDLHQKKRAYERNGVAEYIVWRVRDEAIDWHQLRAGSYELRQPDSDGMIESEIFPGLRLNVPAMLALDKKAVLAALGRSREQ
ncbi:MAG: Uma2 family endonuclease [Chloroflexi bacterium]|nr:Uma2 family endonuclease [Chloroflexota bacterium]